MTVQEKRQAIINHIIRREGKNQYTQSSKRDLVEDGYSDCSSLTHWAHQKALGIDIGDDTTGQIRTGRLKTVDVAIRDGIPDEADLELGDLLFFRGRDSSRDYADYVGHVEVYVGNGQTSGHGSGIGPVRKNMVDYCRMRQESSSPVPAGNRGLICVRRAVWGAENEESTPGEDAGNDVPLNPAPQKPSEDVSEADRIEAVIRSAQRWVNEYLAAEIQQGILTSLTLDGRGGPRTRKALVICLQKFHNQTYGTKLALDGSFGPATKRACRAVKRGRRDSLVRVCQAMLYIRGYDPRGFDGNCGGGCVRSILAYQEDHDLTTDESCGPATFEAMFEKNIRN